MKQNSREAIIDLMMLSVYLDGRISSEEDQLLNEVLDLLGWDSSESREAHLFASFKNAQEIAKLPDRVEAMIQEKSATVKANGDEGAALTWLTRIISSDGVTRGEMYFLKLVEARLFS